MSRYDDINASERTTVRWVRRRDEPSSPLWPGAFWPILGILALSLFSCAHIQEQTEAAVERELTAANLEWAEANASGRTIYLTGEAPSREAADRAESVAKLAKTGTWLGEALVPAPVRCTAILRLPAVSPMSRNPRLIQLIQMLNLRRRSQQIR